MRRLILTLHLTVALVAGLLLVLLGVTGSIMAFEVELTHRLSPALWYVTPQPPARSLAELGAAASSALHGEVITGYNLSVVPDLSYQVQFKGKTVFINQYTAQVLGVRVPAPTFLSNVHQLHLRLLWQDKQDRGKTIVTWGGVATLFLLVSGCYLWWPVKRVWLRSGTPKRFWFDLHNMVGVLSLVFVLILAATGVMMGFENITTPWLYSMTSSAPLAMYGHAPVFQPKPGATSQIDPDGAIAIARAALPGAVPLSVNVPVPGGLYALSARFPEDLTPGGRSRIYIDSSDGRVVVAEGSRTAPSGTKLVTLNRALHTGDVFGIPSKIVMSIASAMVVVQLVSGVVWWLKKRVRRATARTSKPASAL